MSDWKVVQEPSKRPDKPKRKSGGRILKMVLPLALVAVLIVGAVAWALPHLPIRPQTQSGLSYSGVVEMWNVESFEGGVGSRSSWLKARAAQFEKQHSGLFVHVTDLTVEQLAAKLQQGDSFDIVCFSRGAGALVQPYLGACDCAAGAVRDNFLLSGQLNGTQYALPIYTGVYCLLARSAMLSQEQLLSKALSQTYTRRVGKTDVSLAPLVCGFTPYNSPLSALAMSGGRGSITADESVTQYMAYEQFLANRTAVTLLGTQRDMCRLFRREADGTLETLAFAPLGGYTDLVQYVGISAASGDKSAPCRAFAEHLLSEQTQSALVNLCLFSVLEGSIYTDERYLQCELALSGSYVPNVFGDADAVARQRQTALSTLAV